MIPHFAKNDLQMFYKYLDNCTNYLEFGSGGSTYQASIRKNIKKIISFESDKDWFLKLKNEIKHNNFIYNFIDLKCKPNNWGHPSKECSISEYKNYTKLNQELLNNIDLILIDGRFRVCCALKCHSLINNECKIAFDDFLDRKHYHIVLDYFDIIDKTKDNRMVILKKKNKLVPEELIKKYEIIPA